METRRTYRQRISGGHLCTYPVTVRETDLFISTGTRLDDLARESVLTWRGQIESYISQYPEFLHSLVPWNPPGPAPSIIRSMSFAAAKAGVGPMASVAGAIAEAVGKDLLAHSQEVIVENGGDIFIQTHKPIIAAVFAGTSPLSMKFGLRIDRSSTGIGLCTSSGKIGHSKSFGLADAVCVRSDDCALADAAATAIGNRVRSFSDVEGAIDFGRSVPGITGILIVVASRMGVWGEMELVPLQGKNC